MTRLLGPDLNSRLAYVPAAGVLLSAAGASAVVFAGPTGSTLADIQIYDGTSTPAGPVPNSTLIVDGNSLIPRFWFPDDIDTVYVEVHSGTRTAMNADYDMRIDNVSGFVDAPLMTTGVLGGGEINVNGTNPKAIDITPLIGYIVDYATNPLNPTVTRIATTSTLTVVLDAAAQTRFTTWWLMDVTGAIIQQANRPTNTQRRTHLQLGTTTYDPIGGTIFVDQTLPVILTQPINQFFDLMYALGAFSVTGNVIAANGADLTFSKTAGEMFSPAFSHYPRPNDPHITSVFAQAPVTFRHATRAPGAIGARVTALDVANYDNNGVITPVGGGANNTTNFRVFVLAANNVLDQIIVQYDQDFHSSLSNAIAGLSSGRYITNPDLSGTGALIGYITAVHTATNLSDPAQAIFTPANKFVLP